MLEGGVIVRTSNLRSWGRAIPGVAVIAISLGGCASMQDVEVVGRLWQLDSVSSGDDGFTLETPYTPPVTDTAPFLQFREDGTFRGPIPCSYVEGQYELHGDRLRPTGVLFGLGTCLDEDSDEVRAQHLLSGLLSGDSTLDVNDGELIVHNEDVTARYHENTEAVLP